MLRYLTCAKPFGTNAWLDLIRHPPVNGPKDPWPRVLSLSGARVVCWRPHLAGTRQYIVETECNNCCSWPITADMHHVSDGRIDLTEHANGKESN